MSPGAHGELWDARSDSGTRFRPLPTNIFTAITYLFEITTLSQPAYPSCPAHICEIGRETSPNRSVWATSHRPMGYRHANENVSFSDLRIRRRASDRASATVENDCDCH